VTKYAN